MNETGNIKQVKRARKKAAQLEREAVEEMKLLLQDAKFRRFLIRLLLETHHRTVYSGFGAGAGVMAAFIAVENIGKKVLDWVLQASPNAYTLLMTEAGVSNAPSTVEEEEPEDDDAS
jgi:hypothetical protein